MTVTFRNTMQCAFYRAAGHTLAVILFSSLLLAGCDTDSSVGPDPDPGPDPTPGHNVAVYDTTNDVSNGRPVIEVEEQDGGGVGYVDADGNEVTDVTWSSDYVYLLKGRVYINDGQRLTIEPGTIIQGEYRAVPSQASVLIVAQGGQIFADGEQDGGSIDPIIFTAEGDEVDQSADIDLNTRAAWGGVLILGRAPTNTTPGVINIEGIPSTEERGAYGGDDPEDDSGVFRYVSIRYGGISIGEGNEINGLTMGGVGRGTTIEYVEVFNNLDDGFEWFGGTVDTKYLVSAFSGDDSFDIDQGFQGRGQFWLAVQAEDPADRTAEHDGGDSSLGGEDSQPWANSQIYNATYIGSGQNGVGDLALKLRENWAGSYYNSIFIDFPGQAIEVEDREQTTDGDSRARFEEGTLRIENNLFWRFGAGATFADIVKNGGDFGAALAQELTETNRIADPQLGSISRTNDGGLNPLPAAGGAAFEGAATPPNDGFFEQVDYIGAFGDVNWATGWTFLDQAGFLGD